MAAEPGLRERKKQQTRQQIFQAAHRLFSERGFDAVTVADIARLADVSEVTVFNYFPNKEDLFFAGMQFFEEQLLEAVRMRPRGEPAIRALKGRLLESVENLGERGRIAQILKAGDAMSSSPSLAIREREIVDRYTRLLAELLAGEAGIDPDDVEPMAAAAALFGAHRAVVQRVRKQVIAGRRGAALIEDTRTQIQRAFGRLEKGLEDYAKQPNPAATPGTSPRAGKTRA
ncbi:MAG: TetR family transcriptional regulator [Chloroflexi bacterium]|nr:MAG: TetR family transcriptional regulator [Chloroflexota bacterium]